MVYHSGNQLLDPFLLFQKAHLRRGMRLADFGCGATGHLVFPAAQIVSETGIIYAIDIMKDVLENVKKRAAMHHLPFIHPVWADVEKVGATAVPAGSLDCIFLVNILRHARAPLRMLDEAARLLGDKGRIIVVDWNVAPPFGARQGEPLVDFSRILAWAKDHHFVIQEQFEAGDYHHGIVFYTQT